MEEEYEEMDDSKRQTRNRNEKKRRDQFNMLVSELNAMISTSNRRMDKSSILMAAISFLKNHNEVIERSRMHEIQEDCKPASLSNEEFTHLIFEALEGFLFVFSDTGRIYYASEGITSLLGYVPANIVNSQVMDFISEEDHPQLIGIMSNCKEGQDFCFTFNFKKRYADVRVPSTYELVQLAGFTQVIDQLDENIEDCKENEDRVLFVCTGRMCNPQLVRDITLHDSSRKEFTSRHSLEWKFLFLDHRAPPIIGYLPFEVLGTSGYDYYHFDDLDKVVDCHRALMQTGALTSCFYRFLTKGQQWIWLQTCFYITYHQWNSKPEFIMCTHRVVSFNEVCIQNAIDVKKKENMNIESHIEETVVREGSHAKNAPAAIPKNMVDGSNIPHPNMMPLNNIMGPPAPLNIPDTSIDVTSTTQNVVSSAPNMSSCVQNMPNKTKKEVLPNDVHLQNMPIRNAGPMSSMTVLNTGRLLNVDGSSPGQIVSGSNLSSMSGQPPVSQPPVNIESMSMAGPNGVSNIVHPNTQQMCEYSPMPLFSSLSQSHMNTSSSMSDYGNGPESTWAQTHQVFPNGANLNHDTNPNQLNGLEMTSTPMQYHESTVPISQANAPDSNQTNLEDELQRKHEQLQQLIVRQQEELRQVKEQLLLARLGINTSTSSTQQQQQQQLLQQQQQHLQQLQQQQQHHQQQFYQAMSENNMQQNYPPTSNNQHYMP